jgi:predicted MFS family arabinose efflux permease
MNFTVGLRKACAPFFKPDSAAVPLVLYTLFWGMAEGGFAAAINNFLVNVHSFTVAQRGMMELFREMPGLLLVVLLSLLHRVSDWRILRIGMACAAAGIFALCLPFAEGTATVTALVTVWALGEHIVMPVRSAVALELAREKKGSEALGFLTGVFNGASVIGNLAVAAIFFAGLHWTGAARRNDLFTAVWMMVGMLTLAALATTFSRRAPGSASVKRPRLLLRGKYWIYYGLEIFYGARKQVFLVFGPMVLIKRFGVTPGQMAFLLGATGIINSFVGPWVGRVTARIGYRAIMVWDTVILFFVCLLYGFAERLIPSHAVACAVVVANFVLDCAITTTSMATSLYVKDIAASQEELTATLSTGISMNHLISILVGVFGGVVWVRWGVETLFAFSAFMALANSGMALCIPRALGGRTPDRRHHGNGR